jgi:hypothetical protein
MTASLESKASFSGTWTAASWEDDLRRWSEFLGAQGVTFSADDATRSFVKQLAETNSPSARDGIGMRLGKLADDALAARNDERRIATLTANGARYVLTPAERVALEGEGHRFVVGNPALRTFATIPITLGAYFAAQYACARAGLDRNVAWGIALVVWALTVRVVRGRWPFQRA